MQDHSRLLSATLDKLYPFILIFGIYIIFNGHKTPGGGFQGGALLASVFIVHYLASGDKRIRSDTISYIEKLLCLMIILFAIVMVFYLNPYTNLTIKRYSLIILNAWIGLKVCFGTTVIFYRFIFFESR